MKIGGKKVDSRPSSETMYFQRNEEEIIAIRANAVMDRVIFDKLCPLPAPPKKRVKGNQLVDNFEDPRYISAIAMHSRKYMDWVVITSLCSIDRDTGEEVPIEWEKVDRQLPDTWKLWKEELTDSGFSDMERQRIQTMVLGVNSLTENRLDEARNSFLRTREAAQERSTSQDTEQSDTPSGDLVNGSASDHQESPKVGTTSMTK